LKEDNEYAGGIVNKKSIKTIFPVVLRLIVNYAPLGYMEKMGKINRKVCFTGPFADELIGLGQTQAALKSFGRDSVLGDGSDSLLEIRTILKRLPT
jgi:hypothetical protein